MLKPSENIKATPPVITMWPSAFMIMSELANLAAPNEMSALAHVVNKNGIPVITRVVFRGGRDSMGSTNITREMMSYVWELKQAGTPEKSKELHCWLHSHVDMGTFWSGRDEMTITGEEEGHVCANWQINIVINRNQNMKCTVIQYEPFKCRFDDIDVLFYPDDDPISGVEAVELARAMWAKSREKEDNILKTIFDRVTAKAESSETKPAVTPGVVKAVERVVEQGKAKVEVKPNFWQRQFPFLLTFYDWLTKRRRDRVKEGSLGPSSDQLPKPRMPGAVNPDKRPDSVPQQDLSKFPGRQLPDWEKKRTVKEDNVSTDAGVVRKYHQPEPGEPVDMTGKDEVDSKPVAVDLTETPLGVEVESSEPELVSTDIAPGSVVDKLFTEPEESVADEVSESEDSPKQVSDGAEVASGSELHQVKEIDTKPGGNNDTDHRKHG